MRDAIILAMFVLAPAAVFAQLPAKARRFFLAAAVAALFAVTFLVGPTLGGGGLLIPLALLGIILAALLVEAVALVRRLLGKKGGSAAHG